MKIQIRAKYDIKGVEGVVIDENGNFWKLPYVDAAQKLRKPKLLTIFYHKNYNALKVNQRIYSEKYLNSQRVLNPRVLTFET